MCRGYTDNSYVSDDVRASLLTVKQRFEQLRDAYINGAHQIKVNYDPQYGYPSSVNIDYDQFIADEALSYTITELAFEP